jgi:hypothetical protein
MLSKSALKGMSLALRFVCSFKTGAYKWDPVGQKLTVSKELKDRFLFFLSTAFIHFHFLYTSFRVVHNVLFRGGSTTTFLLQLTLVGQAGLSVSCQLNTVLRPVEMAEFITGFLQSDRKLTSK